MHDNDFFPLEWVRTLQHTGLVTNRLPFPLADCCRRLQREIMAGQPLSAAWTLKDALEAGIKFAASLAIADLLHGRPSDKVVAPLLEILFKQGGLTLGDWSRLLQIAVLRVTEGTNLLPVLRSALVRKGSRVTPLMGKIGCYENNVVVWRNRIFGHGVFQHDPAFYAREVIAWHPFQQELYQVLHETLAGWDLEDENGVSWRGAGDPPPWDGHEHQDKISGERLYLIREKDSLHLPLGPLLSIQECEICHFPHAHFFDRNIFRKKCHRTGFLDYFQGHLTVCRDHPDVIALASRLPATYRWSRSDFDQEVVVAEDNTIFRFFADEYRPPEYLYQEVEKLLDSRCGYLELIGPEGYGKTWFVRGLTEKLRGEGVKVLPYYIRAGERSDYRTFVTLLADEAQINSQVRTQEIQTKVDSRNALAEQFVDFLDRLSMADGGSQILVILDGLDELTDPVANQASVIDFLPPAEDLPEACRILLTRREQVRPYTGQALARLQRPDLFRTVVLYPEQEENNSLIRSYISAHLPGHWVDEAMESSQGVFLYAFHLTQAIKQGAFAEGESLPYGTDFYPVYLEKICSRVGEKIFNDAYLTPLLLLAAARQPVSQNQLEAWGVRRDHLRHAMLDIRDFLHEYRSRQWLESLDENSQEYRYQIAHDSFIRYLHRDLQLSEKLVQTHRHILEITLSQYENRWQKLDLSEDQDLYALRFSLDHARLGNVAPELMERLCQVEYSKACQDWAEHRDLADRPQMAMELCELCLQVLIIKRFDTDAGALLLRARALCFKAWKLNEYYKDHAKSQQVAENGIEQLENCQSLFSDQIRKSEINDLRGRLLLRKGFALLRQGRLDQARLVFEQALRSLEEGTGSAAGKRITADVFNGIAITALYSYDRETAAVYYGRAIELYRQATAAGEHLARHRGVVVLINRAEALRNMNRFTEAGEAIDEAVLQGKWIYEHENSVSRLASALSNKGSLLYRQGRISAALACVRDAIELRMSDVRKKKSAPSYLYSGNMLNKSTYLQSLGYFPESVAAAKGAVDWRRKEHKTQRRITNGLGISLRTLALAQVAAGQLEEALENAAEAVQFLREPVDRGKVQGIEGWAAAVCVLGMILTRMNQRIRAREMLDKGLAELGKRYYMGARVHVKIFAQTLFYRAQLLKEDNKKQALADLQAAKKVAAEQWQGGGFFMAPDYLKTNLQYAELLQSGTDWQGLVDAVNDHIRCLKTVADNLPGGDPEPLERCLEPAQHFFTWFNNLDQVEQVMLCRALGEDYSEYLDRLLVRVDNTVFNGGDKDA